MSKTSDTQDAPQAPATTPEAPSVWADGKPVPPLRECQECETTGSVYEPDATAETGWREVDCPICGGAGAV